MKPACAGQVSLLASGSLRRQREPPSFEVRYNCNSHALAWYLVDGVSGIEHAPNIKIYDDVAKLFAQTGSTYTHTYMSGMGIFGTMTYAVRRYGLPSQYSKVRRFVPWTRHAFRVA